MLSHFHLYGELRFSGVTGRRNCLSGLHKMMMMMFLLLYTQQCYCRDCGSTIMHSRPYLYD